MPYAPGVTDISGQLLAQGMQQRAQGIAGGLVDWVKGYDQNQALKRQGVSAFAGVLASDPDFQQYIDSVAQGKVKVPDAVAKAVKNYQSGDVDVYDAAILGNTGQIFQKSKGEAMQRQMAQSQMAAQRAQTANLSAEAMTKLADLGFYAKRPDSGVDPQTVNALQAFLRNSVGGQAEMPATMGQAPTNVAGPVSGAVPASGMTALDQFVRQQAPARPAPPSGIEQFAAPAAQAASPGMPQGGLRAQSGFDFNAPWSPANPAGIVDPEQVAEEIRSQLPPSKRNSPDITKKIQDIVDRRSKERERLMQAKEYMPASQPRAIEGGTLLQNYDTRTGQPIGDPVPNPQHPAVAAEIVRQQEMAKAKVEDAKSYVGSINNAAGVAIDERARFNRIKELYNQGTPSGPWSDYTLGLRSTFAELGVGDPTKTAKESELKALLARSALNAARTFYKGQGAVDREERRRIDQAIEAFDKGRISNDQLMKLAEAQNEKLIAASEYGLELEKADVPLDKQAVAMRQWWMKNPLDQFVDNTETYVLNNQGALVKKPQGSQRQAAPSTTTPQGLSLPAGWKTR